MGFAAGARAGYDAVSGNKKRKREDEEYARQESIRREGANTLGNIGQEREDGSTYTEDQAYQDYSRFIAQYDPTQSMQAREKGAGLRETRRQQGYADMADKALEFRRRIAAGEDPRKVYMEAAGYYNQVPDGKSAGVSADGQHLVVMDATTGQATVLPFTPENAMKAVNAFHALASPKAMQQEQELGLKQRQVGAQEKNASATERNAARQEEFYKPGGVYERTHQRDRDMYLKYLSASRGRGNLIQLQDEAGNAVYYERDPVSGGFRKVDLPPGLHFPKAKLGWQPVQGNPGMFSDGQGHFGMLNDRTRQIEPVELPGQSLEDRLAAQMGSQGAPGDDLTAEFKTGGLPPSDDLNAAYGGGLTPPPVQTSPLAQARQEAARRTTLGLTQPAMSPEGIPLNLGPRFNSRRLRYGASQGFE